MKTVQNIAYEIIRLSAETGEPITNIKLQKLLYYCYAWYLVETNNKEKLFNDQIEAWQYGPVVPNAYHEFKRFGADNISYTEEEIEEKQKQINFSELEKDVISQTFFAYAHRSATTLVSLTHSETPWILAFDSKKEGAKVINPNDIFSFFNEKKRLAKTTG